ncbi:MAG: hypothetical protein ACP5O8_00130, partial [Candidatus Aenigmatarchaeota archaeon]
FLIVFLLYSNVLIFCVLVSILSIFPALKISEKKKVSFDVKKIFEILDINKKPKIFKVALIAFFILGLSLGLTADYIFPLFLKENGLETETIGLILGAQAFIVGISLSYFVIRLSFKKIIVYSAILYFSLLLLLCFIKGFLVSLILIAFGFAYGLLTAGIEAIFTKTTTNYFAYGTDVGLLMTTFHAGKTISLGVSGFLISFYGFPPLFLASALIFFLYSFLVLKYLRKG